MSEKYYWTKTDTAAIMFTALQKKNSARVFRFSIVLKEDVDGEKLRAATARVMKKRPEYSYKFKKGFFWGYLEKTDILPRVTEDDKIIAKPRNLGANGGPELEILYYKRRISIELSHVLTDGGGTLQFAKSLLQEYFSDEIAVDEAPAVSFDELTENAYGRYYDKTLSTEEAKPEKAFRLAEIINETTAKYYSGLMPISQLKEKSKMRGMTITEYLAAVYVYSIIKSATKPIDNSIVLSIPINFRNYFPTSSIRNFSGDTSLKYTGRTDKDVSFEDVCESISGKLRETINKESVQNFINSKFALTINPILRIVPFFIKKPVLDVSQKNDHANNMTSIITNLGNVSFGEELDRKIERLECVGGDIRIYGLTTMASVVGFNGFLNIFLNSSIENTTLFRDFFRTFAEDGIDVRVESSHDNGFDEEKKSSEGKRCECCGIDLAEEYTLCPLCHSAAVDGKKHIEGFETACYSSDFKERDAEKAVKISHKPSLEKLKAYFNI